MGSCGPPGLSEAHRSRPAPRCLLGECAARGAQERRRGCRLPALHPHPWGSQSPQVPAGPEATVRVSHHTCALPALELGAASPLSSRDTGSPGSRWVPWVPCITRGLGHSLHGLSGETFPQEQVLGQRQNRSQSRGLPPHPGRKHNTIRFVPVPVPLLPPPRDSLGLFIRGGTVVDSGGFSVPCGCSA